MTEATIKLDADDTALVQKTRKFAQQMGQETASAGAKIVNSLGKALITAGAIRQVIVGAAEAFSEVVNKAGEISKKAGGSRLGADVLASQLNLGQAGQAILDTGIGSRSAEETQNFARGLAGQGITGARAINALRGFGSGVLSDEEAINLSGVSASARREALIRQRTEGLSEQSRLELLIRQRERESEANVRATANETGLRKRLSDARLDELRAENPWSFAVAGALGRATAPLGGEALIEAGTTGSMMLRQTEVLEGIKRNTERPLNLSAAQDPEAR